MTPDDAQRKLAWIIHESSALSGNIAKQVV